MTGRMSAHWAHAQRAHQLLNKIDRPTLRWTSAVIKQLFEIAWDMWNDRNGVKHMSTTAAAQREMQDLDEEIQEHLALGVEGIAQHDRGHLRLSAARQRHMSVEEKRRWLHTAEAIRVAHANRAHPTIPGVHTITTYFPRVPPAP